MGLPQGGTISVVGDRRIHTFSYNSGAPESFIIDAALEVDSLSVGGGGGGGGGAGTITTGCA